MNMKQAVTALILGPFLVWVAMGVLVVRTNKRVFDSALDGLGQTAGKILTAIGQGA